MNNIKDIITNTTLDVLTKELENNENRENELKQELNIIHSKIQLYKNICKIKEKNAEISLEDIQKQHRTCFKNLLNKFNVNAENIEKISNLLNFVGYICVRKSADSRNAIYTFYFDNFIIDINLYCDDSGDESYYRLKACLYYNNQTIEIFHNEYENENETQEYNDENIIFSIKIFQDILDDYDIYIYLDPYCYGNSILSDIVN